MPAKRKCIKLRKGTREILAAACGVSVRTVDRALAWTTDSDNENLVRKRAKELGFIKRF